MEFKKKKDLPIYEIIINDDDNTGINLVSLVDEPAIEIKGQYFAKRFRYYDRPEVHPNCKCKVVGDKWILDDDACNICVDKKAKFDRATKRKKDRNNRKNKGKSSQPGASSFSAIKEQQMIIGIALRADIPIYRRDEDGTEYYVTFSKDTIKRMVYKFNSKNKNTDVNISHTNQMAKSFIAENWIVEDTVYDKSMLYNLDAEIGDWAIMTKVNDLEIWDEQVKKLEKFGYSIEGILGHKLIEMCKEEEDLEEDGNTIEKYLEMLEHFNLNDLQEIIQSFK